MGLTHNPTRRTGPRTGAVHIPKALLDRIMRALVRKGRKTPGGLVFRFDDDVPPLLRQAMEESGHRVPTALSLGAFNVPNYVTGRVIRVPVSITQGASAAGRAGLVTGGERRVPMSERRERVREALRKLRVTLPPKKTEALTEQIFSWRSNIEISVDLPARPLREADLRQVRAVLAHELTHVADQAARLYQEREDKKGEALTDVDMISEELGLGGYSPKKHEEIRGVPGHGAGWANDREEVTAMISEIMEEVGLFSENIGAFRVTRAIDGKKPFKSRERELIAFFRWVSPTFAEFASEWEPKNLNRVLRALWDRYHTEKSFPQARGVYKNRRTSRRRTSRRFAGGRAFA